jgi:hypothetical protein
MYATYASLLATLTPMPDWDNNHIPYSMYSMQAQSRIVKMYLATDVQRN